MRTATTLDIRQFWRYVAAECVCLLLSFIPWLFVVALPVYVIVAAQLYFSENPLWQKVAASVGPFLLWLAALLLWKSFTSLY